MKRQTIRWWIYSFTIAQILLAITFFSSQIARASEEKTYSVFLNEIMGEGSSASDVDKWIELYNSSDEIIDLKGWSVVNEIKASGKGTVPIAEGLIAPHGYFLLAHNAEDKVYQGGEAVLNIDPDVISSSVSWDKSEFKLSLRDDEGNLVDIAGNGGVLPKGQGFNPKRSIGRVNYLISGEAEEAWDLSAEAGWKYLDPGAVEFATPQNSGRPKIDNAELFENRFPKGQGFNLNFSYSVSDSYNDLERVTVSLLSGEKIIDLKEGSFGESNFSFSRSEFCPTVRLIFYDKTGLWTIKDFQLICYQISSQVKISEILPHPKNRDWNSDGKIDKYDEWIELVNLGIDDIDLSGWEIRDKVGKIFQLDDLDNKVIKAGGFLLIYSPKPIIINDDGEELLLVDPEGKIADSVQIPESKEDIAYARDGDAWQWTKTPTPGEANQIVGFEEASDQIAPAVEEVAEDIDDVSEPTVRLAVVTTTKELDLSNLPTEIPKIDAYVLGAQASNSFARAFLESRYLLYLASLVMLITIIFIYEFSRQRH